MMCLNYLKKSCWENSLYSKVIICILLFQLQNFSRSLRFSGSEYIPLNTSPLIALTSTSDLTICRYTAFLSLLHMLSHTCCATERRRWFFVIRRTKTFSEYCDKINHQSSISQALTSPQ